MPVIQCLGFFLGMTASSLSVMILIRSSSSRTLAQLPPGGDSPTADLTTVLAMRRSSKIAGRILMSFRGLNCVECKPSMANAHGIWISELPRRSGY